MYEHYADKVGEALDLDTAIFEYARFFDISLVKDGEKIQPAEGSSVNVKMRAYYGADKVVPVYIEVEDGERLQRALDRERSEKNPMV